MNDLIVYQKQRALAKSIFELSKSFPKEERYALTDQIRRSSRSIGGQIAEAWAKREYERHFYSKLTDADGELEETRHWLETAHDCKYVDSSQLGELLHLSVEIGRMLESMKARASAFCGGEGPVVREDSEDLSSFFVENTDV